MKSSELLKLIRKFTGKTQKEFVEGVVSESYYSKVERGIHQIDAVDFFEIIKKNYWSSRLPSNLQSILVQGENTKRMERLAHEIPRTGPEEKLTSYLKEFYEILKQNRKNFSQPVYLYLLQFIASARPEILNEEEKDLIKFDLKNLKINSQLLRRLCRILPLYSEEEFVKIMRLTREYISTSKRDFGIYLKFAEVANITIRNKNYSKSKAIIDELKKMLTLIKNTDTQNISYIFAKTHIFDFGEENLGNIDKQRDQAILNVLEKISPKNNRPNG